MYYLMNQIQKEYYEEYSLHNIPLVFVTIVTVWVNFLMGFIIGRESLLKKKEYGEEERTCKRESKGTNERYNSS